VETRFSKTAFDLNKTYTVNISFEEIKLPPFQDIMVLGKNSLQGKIGLSKSFELLAPNVFEAIDITQENVEAVFVSKSILQKIPIEQVLEILQTNVFPYVYPGELISVDFKVRFSARDIIVKGSGS